MPIIVAPEGKALTVRKIGADESVKRRLRDLGITEGGRLTLLRSYGGNVVVSVLGGNLCLDGGTAGKILVSVA